MGVFVWGRKTGMVCSVQGDKNCMGCFVRDGKSMGDVLSGVSKNGMGFLSRDVLSYIHKVQMPRLGIHAQKFPGCELELHTYIPLAPQCSLCGPTTSPFLST